MKIYTVECEYSENVNHICKTTKSIVDFLKEEYSIDAELYTSIMKECDSIVNVNEPTYFDIPVDVSDIDEYSIGHEDDCTFVIINMYETDLFT